MRKIQIPLLFFFLSSIISSGLNAQRDPYLWPFAQNSIWNLPIHNDAIYKDAGIGVPSQAGLTADEDYLILTPEAPLTPIYTNNAGWHRDRDRCPMEGPEIFKAPIPDDYVINSENWLGLTPNSGLAVLMPDGVTIKQTQPFARCEAGGYGTSRYTFADVNIYEDGIRGAHGGSGMSAIGGTIRLGELVPGGVIRHAMKINVYAAKYLYYDEETGGHRWPAPVADSYADRVYGTKGTPEYECRMGALLALQPDLDLESLNFETGDDGPAMILATAFQNYGAYIVDDTAWDVVALCTEFSPTGRVIDEFHQAWGYGFETAPSTPFGRDMAKIITRLHVVTNNAADQPGGGPASDLLNRRAPVACDFGTPGSGLRCSYVNHNEDSLAIRDDIVFYGGFEDGYNNTAWRNRWGIPWIQRATDNKIVTNNFIGEKALRVSYPKGGVGPGETGTQFPLVFDRMTGLDESHYNEIYLRYYLKFEEGFDFRLGGKLPGLMGGGNSWSRSGGDQPDGTNGWTMRFMWRRDGQIVVYAYLPPSENGKWGGVQWGQNIDCDFAAQPGKWHCIEQYINVGTPGEDDGKLIVWIDGVQRLDIDDMRFWDVENDYGLIGGVYFSTFHGGNTSDWAPHVDSYAQYDGIVMAKNRVGPKLRDTVELKLDDIELAEGYSGMRYRDQLSSASGGVQPYRWYDESNALPVGLQLSRDGKISGFSEDVVSKQINFKVKDQLGQTAFTETNITISSGENVNLANGHTVVDHSENFDPGSPLEGLWDGDVSGEPFASPGTADSSAFWAEYDFGKLYRISLVRLFGETTGYWVSNYYTVETRKSNTDEWFVLIDDADCFADQWFETATDDSVRHIRLTVTGDTIAGTVRARAFEVYAGNDFETSAALIAFKESIDLLIAPNPVSDNMQISFSINSDAYVNCALYSLQGKKIGSLARGGFMAGTHELDIDLSRYNLTGNIYLVVFSAAGDTGIAKSSLIIKVVK